MNEKTSPNLGFVLNGRTFNTLRNHDWWMSETEFAEVFGGVRTMVNGDVYK